MALKITERTQSIGFQFETDKIRLMGAMATSEGVMTNISASINDIDGNYLGSFNEDVYSSLSVNILDQKLMIDAVKAYELARVEIIKEAI